MFSVLRKYSKAQHNSTDF